MGEFRYRCLNEVKDCTDELIFSILPVSLLSRSWSTSCDMQKMSHTFTLTLGPGKKDQTKLTYLYFDPSITISGERFSENPFPHHEEVLGGHRYSWLLPPWVAEWIYHDETATLADIDAIVATPLEGYGAGRTGLVRKNKHMSCRIDPSFAPILFHHDITPEEWAEGYDVLSTDMVLRYGLNQFELMLMVSTYKYVLDTAFSVDLLKIVTESVDDSDDLF